MTQVSGSRESSSAQRPAARPSNARGAQPDDVRAMSDAFAAARAKMKPDGVKFDGLGARQGKMAAGKGGAADIERRSTDAALGAAFDRKVAERQQSERQADGQGFALPGQAAPPPPVTLAMMPSPQVDPGAFAQMLADLWTRENGRGAKEVRVKFGADAWPATDALLVRNAAGTLDIAVGVGAGGGTRALAGLDEHLSQSGLEIGSLTLVDALG